MNPQLNSLGRCLPAAFAIRGLDFLNQREIALCVAHSPGFVSTLKKLKQRRGLPPLNDQKRSDGTQKSRQFALAVPVKVVDQASRILALSNASAKRALDRLQRLNVRVENADGKLYLRAATAVSQLRGDHALAVHEACNVFGGHTRIFHNPIVLRGGFIHHYGRSFMDYLCAAPFLPRINDGGFLEHVL